MGWLMSVEQSGAGNEWGSQEERGGETERKRGCAQRGLFFAAMGLGCRWRAKDGILKLRDF